jgi:hypothetical protein
MKRTPAQRKYKSSSKTTINRSVRKNFFRIGVVLVVFFVSLILLFSYSFYKYLNQKFASALSYTSYSISDDQIPTVSYIVAEDLNSDPIVIKKVNFIIFNKENKKVSIYDISVDSDFSLPGKFGNEVLSKAFALGGLNSENRFVSGAEAVNRSIFKLFGFKVDKFLLTDIEHSKFFDELWHDGGVLNYKSLRDVSSLGENLKTNLDIREFYDLMSFIRSLPKDRVVDENNGPKNFQNTDGFDSYVKEFTYESPLAKDQKNIAVLNGTNFSGLASFGSRVINNYGGRVVASSSSSRTYDKSVIITDDLSSDTTNFLSRVFKITNILSSEHAGHYLENEVDRSDVVVIFGFDTSGDLY